ncbi:MAG: 3-oxo-tetronate kinase, partial [Burkholderiales bacterium]
ANNLVRAGMRVVQTIGVPGSGFDAREAEVEAVVVALKSRTVPPQEAVAQSLAALGWLRRMGAKQFYFKYCSTFDSRFEGEPRGNIGPVTEALMSALNSDFTIATPAFPDNQRTVFKGYLFVGDLLLSESSMRNHPLTPMTDSNLVRVLQAQCATRKVGLVDRKVVARGPEAIRQRFEALRAEGVQIAVIDSVDNDDLWQLGPTLKDMPLVTAGSGVAIALPKNFGIEPAEGAAALPPAAGLQAVVSGSCSAATNEQVQHFIESGRPAFALDPLELAAGEDLAEQALAWVEPLLADGPVLVYSTAEAAAVKQVQAKLGVDEAGAMVERTLAAVARGLVERGVRQLIVAGGETSGACVQALGIEQLRIGPQIAPGVPWCHARSQAAGDGGLHLTLKSGNFGAPDFFTQAFTMLG